MSLRSRVRARSFLQFLQIADGWGMMCDPFEEALIASNSMQLNFGLLNCSQNPRNSMVSFNLIQFWITTFVRSISPPSWARIISVIQYLHIVFWLFPWILSLFGELFLWILSIFTNLFLWIISFYVTLHPKTGQYYVL